jgi:eukaryotic-like serine/threonine-protein kinase
VTDTSGPVETSATSTESRAIPDQSVRRASRSLPGSAAWWGSLPLTWRVFLTVVAVVATVLAAALLLLTMAAARAADVTSARALDRTTRLIAVLLQGQEHALMRGAQVFVQNPESRALVMAGRAEDVLDVAIEAVQRTGASWVQITDTAGVRLAKSDEPTAPAVSLSSSALIGGALDGTPTSGVGVTGDSLLFQAVAVPFTVGSRVAGVLMAAQVVGSALASEVDETTASDVVFYVTDTAGAPHIAASTLERDSALVALLRRFAPEVERTSPTDSSAEAADRGSAAQVEVELGGEHFVGRGAALRSAGGEVLGGFIALRSREAELAPYVALRRWIVVAGLLGLAVAFVLSYLTARSIAQPVLALAEATRRAAEGDYSAAVEVRTADEVGALATAVRTMLADLREKESLVALLRAAPTASRTAIGVPAALAVLPSGASVDERVLDVPEPIGCGRVVARRYEITDQIGIGGSGVVYRAFDRELGEVIALKTVRPDVLAMDGSALERLKSEIRLARRISHRNVVRTHDLGEAEGVYFITMEHVSGTSLRELIERGAPLPAPAVVAIAKQLCRALEVAHEQGVIHRDIKPQNLMVQPDGTLKVMDFGVARLLERASQLTSAGMVVGTPAYMAPEQLLDDPVDGRVDIYAAGVVLYECLTGHRPVEATSPAALLGKLLTATPRPPHEVARGVPVPLSEVVMRALARDVDDRPATAGDLYDLLVRVEDQL